MPVQRRTARELALKTLFQIDVGRHPPSEAIEGALEQLRAPLLQAAAPHFADASRQVADIVRRIHEPGTTRSGRQLRQAHQSVLAELTAFRDALASAARRLLADRPDLTEPQAEDAVRQALARAAEGLKRVAERDAAFPEARRLMASVAASACERAAESFLRQLPAAHRVASFTVRLVRGTLEQQQEIDRRVAALSEGWSLDRQAAVDRNILRLAAYELLFVPDIPVGASINEAVELAKKYSTAESGRFVNGVLGALAAQASQASQAAKAG